MGCAVNCDNKSVYIEAIMSMDEEDQRLIMQSIQELMDQQMAQPEPSLPASLSPSDVKKMMEELSELKKEKEELSQRLHDTEQRVNAVKNEKASVVSELEQLQAQVCHFFICSVDRLETCIPSVGTYFLHVGIRSESDVLCFKKLIASIDG